MDVMLYSFALTTIRSGVPLELGGGGGAGRGSAGDLGAGRDAVRLALGPVWASAFADVVDSGLLGVHGVHGDVANGGRVGVLAGGGGYRAGRRVGGGIGAGGRDVAGAAPGQGDRADAIGVGGGLSAGGAVGGAGTAQVGMAPALRGGSAAGAGDAVDPAEHSGAARNGREPSHGSGRRIGDAISSAAGAARGAVHGDVLLRAVRLLGDVHVAAGVSRVADRAGRRGAERDPLVGMDRAAADWGVLRLFFVRLLCGPGGAACRPSLRSC